MIDDDFMNMSNSARSTKSSVKVGCSYYKPSIVSISDKNGSKKTLDKVVKDAIKNSDSKVNVAINFDGYTKNGEVYSNFGWVNVVDLAVNSKKTSNEKINDLRQMKKLLNGASKDSGNKKVYKKI